MKSLLQTSQWAALRESQGWRAHWVNQILVLEKKLPLGLSFLYAPEVDFFNFDFARNLAEIKKISHNSHSIFLRLDLVNQKNSTFGPKIIKILKDLKLIKSFEEVQPEYRQIVDITRSEERILAQMKPKGRYNIRVAQKHGVVIEKVQIDEISQGISDFYEIFRETAQRDGFEIRPKKYFEKLVEILIKTDLAELIICRYNNIPVAAGIFTYYEENANYLYGASLSKYRNVMAPYLMHWEVIREAKKRGCKVYDLLAVKPIEIEKKETSTKLQDTNGKQTHKYDGITRFKQQFGGQVYQTIGSWDMVYSKFWYSLFKMAEKMRRK